MSCHVKIRRKAAKAVSECDAAPGAMVSGADVPGMGNAVPPGEGSLGSGDSWGETAPMSVQAPAGGRKRVRKVKVMRKNGKG